MAKLLMMVSCLTVCSRLDRATEWLKEEQTKHKKNKQRIFDTTEDGHIPLKKGMRMIVASSAKSVGHRRGRQFSKCMI